MQAASIHTIRKQTFHVRHHGRANAFALQAGAEQFCKEELLPQIEALLNEYNDVSELIHIDKLQINVNSKSIAEFNSSLANKIVKELKKTLSEKARASFEEEFLDRTGTDVNKLLVFYLQNGFFKKGTFINTFNLQEAIAALFQQADAKDQVLEILKLSHTVERFANLINEKQWWQFLKGFSILQSGEQHYLKEDIVALRKLLARPAFESLFFSLKRSFLHALSISGSWDKLADNAKKLLSNEAKFNIEEFKKLPPGTLESALFKNLLVGDKVEKTTSVEIESDEVIEQRDPLNAYTANAGLVLAAVYLPAFFTKVNLVWSETYKQEARALKLLHYIATGSDAAEEWQLVLSKLFMGIPIKKFIRIEDCELTVEEKQLADSMLEALIANWPILKNTTISGLRETFIQRPGSLIFKDDKWQLYIEPEAFDLLLDQLPWQFNMIRLPWMKHLLQVHWRS